MFVLDRVFLDIFHRDAAPLQIVAVEFLVRRLAGPDMGETFRETKRVMHAAIHSHAAERIVYVGRVASEESAALPKCLRDSLMHAVQRRVGDLVVSRSVE